MSSTGTSTLRHTPDAAPPEALKHWLSLADVRIDGQRPWDLQVHNPRLYRRLLTDWTLGVGESYMDGDWDCDRLDELMTRLLRTDIEDAATGFARIKLALSLLRYVITNPQRKEKAFVVGERHYDTGNELFERMLDRRMVYSCAYWERAATLDEAQEHKLEMICRKLQLQPGMRVLEIGCGWGGLAHDAAERYGAQVTGITVSKEQKAYADRLCAGLPVQIRLEDYRATHGTFDRVVSVGMFEHVGPKNYDAYFAAAQRMLEPEGLFLLHTIGLDRPRLRTDPWIDKYIFPGGKIPAASELATAVERWFVLEDWHNFGADYDRTLMAWHANIEAAWPDLQARFDERFRRMWRYYLLVCAGFFRSRQGQLWQLVLTRRDRAAVYRSVRPDASTPGPASA